ncbi:MAG: VWA domain-containing protein [Gemmatimonadetes bacterium]|nr:VWA domain-containing protein [Gemmatimonadota bacterium]
MITFARPALLLLVLGVGLWLWWRRRLRPTAARIADGRVAVAAVGRSWPAYLPLFCRVGALLALIIAAAGPRLPGDRTTVRREGISIVIAVDVSSSMLAEDFAPSNRLEVAKRQAVGFIRGRESDRIGLVAFAGEALTQVPVTLDYPVLERAVLDLRIGALDDGTAIGSGLATATNRLRRVKSRSKVVLLLTDGENNRGAIDPRTAADAAAALGVRVYTIGVGTEGEARIPTGRGLSGYRYEMLPVRIDEVLLNEIAERTGGRYFRAKDSDALSRIFGQIDEMETSQVEMIRYRSADESTRPFLILAVTLLLAELGLASTVAVRAP